MNGLVCNKWIHLSKADTFVEGRPTCRVACRKHLVRILNFMQHIEGVVAMHGYIIDVSHSFSASLIQPGETPPKYYESPLKPWSSLVDLSQPSYNVIYDSNTANASML